MMGCQYCSDVLMLYPAGGPQSEAKDVPVRPVSGVLAYRTDNEAGYWPVRVWRIPDGDRIIVVSSDGAITPCWRCKPNCRYGDVAREVSETVKARKRSSTAT